MEANKAPRLSEAQLIVALQIAAGTYSPTVLQGRTRRALVAMGLVVERDGCPPSYELTDAGRAAIAKATGSAA